MAMSKIEKLIAECNHLTYFTTARQIDTLKTEELQIDDEHKAQLIAVIANRFNELHGTINAEAYQTWSNENAEMLKTLGESIKQSIINLK